MHDRFLRACRRQPVDVTPVWFMRQAGRYMPEYRALRANYSMLELCRTPELATQVTLQPVRALSVDAAILFADILLPLEPMGAPFDFAKGEGPVIFEPVRRVEDVERLRVFEIEEGLGYVLQTIRLLRTELEGRCPLIGFAGAPFTLASYLIEGGKSSHFEKTKLFMYSEPAAWRSLLDKLAEVTRRYLRAQIEAGAECVQLFDSWVGQLSLDDYQTYVAPHVRHVLEDVQSTGVPVIHFGTGTATLLEAMRDAGGTVIGVDWRQSLSSAWSKIGHDRAVQGNFDPCALFAPWPIVESRAKAILDDVAGRPGHIFNLGHGILPTTPVDTVKRLADFVHEYAGQRTSGSGDDRAPDAQP
ncbi:MAG: uroporphyrinogen decarboxylase [Myxococcales bacterium]|nr:uroporphyrinogen decarboxylase [Myxococcales bacterium]